MHLIINKTFSRYSICIRQHPGFCCVQYQVCPDSLDNGFTLDPPGAPATIDVAYVDSDCTKDHVIISGWQKFRKLDIILLLFYQSSQDPFKVWVNIYSLSKIKIYYCQFTRHILH